MRREYYYYYLTSEKEKGSKDMITLLQERRMG
jgi:hypothetical protein